MADHEAPPLLPVPAAPDDPAWGDAVARVAHAFEDGRIVGFPTETVYGVGVRADDDAALLRLRVWKERLGDQPFQWLIAQPEDIHQWAVAGKFALRLARRCWPGPLTLILPRRFDTPRAAPHAPADITVGLRCPDAPFLRAVIQRLGVPIAASSANRAGQPPAESVNDLVAIDARPATLSPGLYVGPAPRVDLIVRYCLPPTANDAGDACALPTGRPSTIARVWEMSDQCEIAVMRPGAFTQEELVRLAHEDME